MFFRKDRDEFEEYQDSLIEEKTYKSSSLKKIIVITLIISIVGGLSIGAGISITNNFIKDSEIYASQREIPNNNEDEKNLKINSSNNGTVSPIVDIAEEVGPSVVAITSKVKMSDWFNNQFTQQGKGSGVIFDIDSDNILILTNNHVINGAEELLVTLGENTEVAAEVVGEDEATDLAIIKIEKKNVPQEVYSEIKPAKFGDSDKLKVGETAIAIGNPLGYNKTVTVGVISALNRDLNFPEQELRLLQTDAAINPGNSGGALVNIKGEVIGINTIKIADTKVEGIGFAIPINFAKPIIKELIDKGYVSRPYLGILGRDVDEETSELYEIPIGVIVVDVMENTAAQRAGIQRGDVIIQVDDIKILSMEQLSNIIRGHETGDSIRITLVRNGKEKKELNVKLGERK